MDGVSVGGPGGVRVLVVDDHALFAEAVAAALGQDRRIASVVHASTLADAEAVLAAQRTPFQVILLDYRLPGSVGVDGIRRVVAAAPDSAVVLVTAVEEPRVLAAAVEAGCSGFITKTRPLDDLVNAVLAAASGEAVVSAQAISLVLESFRARERPKSVQLSPREAQLLTLAARGSSNIEIAQELGLALNTVRNYMQRVLEALGAHSKLEAVAVAVAEGLIERQSDRP